MEENYYLKISLNSDGFKVVATDQKCQSLYLDVRGDISLSRIIDAAKFDGSVNHGITSACSRKQQTVLKDLKAIAWSKYDNKHYSYPFNLGQFVISEEKNKKFKLFIEFNNERSFLISEEESKDVLKKTAARVFPFIKKSYRFFDAGRVKDYNNIRWRIGNGFLRTDSFYFGYMRIEDVSTRKQFFFNLSVVYSNGAALYDSYDNLHDALAATEMLVRLFYFFK